MEYIGRFFTVAYLAPPPPPPCIGEGWWRGGKESVVGRYKEGALVWCGGKIGLEPKILTKAKMLGFQFFVHFLHAVCCRHNQRSSVFTCNMYIVQCTYIYLNLHCKSLVLTFHLNDPYNST
jgi:hypothetical protein